MKKEKPNDYDKYLDKNKFNCREKQAKRFLEILKQNEMKTLSISGPYGIGKTYFIKMMMELALEEKDVGCVYFNAWQYNFWNNPIYQFIGEVRNRFPSLAWI